MDVVVVGIGRVGLVAACCLAKSGHSVVAVEKDGAKLGLLEKGISPVYEQGIKSLLREGIGSGRLRFSSTIPTPLKTDLVMVTVNTPPLKDGSADLSQVFAVVEQVKQAARDSLVLVMKSTVPPGTGEHIIKEYLSGTDVEYVANPEFLRAGSAIDDWYHPSRTVIGTSSPGAADKLKTLYADIAAPLIFTAVTSAEMIKYAANAFLATKVSFINEIANLCELVGADITEVIAGIGADPRIGTSYLQPGIGYGGPCLTKDTRALLSLASNKGHDFKILKATIEVNARQPALVVEKLKKLLGTLKGKEIALLGLAFKPETDDVTDSPALEIARQLLKEGANLRVYDPAAIDNARALLTGGVAFAKDIYAATAGACAAILATEWQDFANADWGKIKEVMVNPYVIIDGRNALPGKKLTDIGFKYITVGRKPGVSYTPRRL